MAAPIQPDQDIATFNERPGDTSDSGTRNTQPADNVDA